MGRAVARPQVASLPAASRGRILQRACSCGSKGHGDCEACRKKRVQRRAQSPGIPPRAVDLAELERGGMPLGASPRGRLEPWFGVTFADVRVHDDAASHRAARALNAEAFTIGQHIHFGAGRYRPARPDGLRLLAHELTHTVQQRSMPVPEPLARSLEMDPPDSPLERAAERTADRIVQTDAPLPAHQLGAHGPTRSRRVVQRVGLGEFLSRLFFEGTFSEAELLAYLQYLDDHAAIEGDYDSDNKAREIIRRWRRGEARFRPTTTQKQLMLLEMIDGPTLDDDERAILELLRGSTDAEVRALLATAGGESALRGEFHGSESDELDAFLAEWHRKPGNQPAEPRAPGARGPRITEIVVNQDTPQVVTVRFSDGRIEADTCSAGKGTCCVEPGSNTGPSAAQTQQTDSNWTPIGTHPVMFTRAVHRNGIPWWTQFHARAIALHEYAPVDGTPLSHGCVRLHGAFARRIHEGVVPGRTVVRVIGSPRPRCDHGELVHEWEKDFRGGTAADGDPELRRHLQLSFGVGGAELDRRIAAGVIPRCTGGRAGRGAGGRP